MVVQSDLVLPVVKLVFGDINGDSVVDVSDLAILALSWEPQNTGGNLRRVAKNLSKTESPWD